MTNPPLILAILLLCCMIGAGCTGSQKESDIAASWNLSLDGSITFSLPPCQTDENVQSTADNMTITDLVFRGFAGSVHAILVCPKQPYAFLVWAPGANNPAAGYVDYMTYYPRHGIGVLIMDVRGNGGLTPGYPLNIERDLDLFVQGQWPEFYLNAADMIIARHFLQERYPKTPIYAVGESNGGRYAALAAGADPGFTGYIGISTSGFHQIGRNYTSPVREFLLSIDPEIQTRTISPRPIILFHAPDDPIIPFAEGEMLAQAAGNETVFFPFNGTHGVNREVDDTIIDLLSAKLKGTRGEP